MRPGLTALILLTALLVAGSRVEGGDSSTPGAQPGQSRSLIVVGLPGDSSHELLFRVTAEAWRDWLVGTLGFAPGEVRIVAGTRESIARESESIRARSSAEDRLWVFVLGHANLDEGHVWLHLPGPDLSDDEFAQLFRGIPCLEQVFWMTTAGSGAFVKPLAQPGRIVIAATEPAGELNETEFPHALAEVARRPPARLDRNQDGFVSLLELFETTAEAVEARFAADKRAPTEHPRIDDNGDGIGTEPGSAEKPKNADGLVASRRILIKSPPLPSPRSENGTKPVVSPAR